MKGNMADVFPDEETVRKHTSRFTSEFLKHFNEKWQEYRKLENRWNTIKRKAPVRAFSAVFSSRERGSRVSLHRQGSDLSNPRPTSCKPDLMPDSTIEDNVDSKGRDTLNSNVSSVNNATEHSDTSLSDTGIHCDEDDLESESQSSDSYMDTLKVTFRHKQVHRVVSSTYSLRAEIQNEIISDIANELAASYEYQLAVLASIDDVTKVAHYAVHCLIESLQSRDSIFDSETLVVSVLDENPGNLTLKRSKLKTRLPSKNINSTKTVDWTVHGFFQKPGLRFSDNKNSKTDSENNRSLHFCGCFSPFGSVCVPEMYGYRNPLRFRHEGSGDWKVTCNDLASILKFQNTSVKPGNLEETGKSKDKDDWRIHMHKAYVPVVANSYILH